MTARLHSLQGIGGHGGPQLKLGHLLTYYRITSQTTDE